MIDIHSHILPGLDDGPRTLEESIEMLHVAAGSGTTAMVATPHANSRYSFQPAHAQALLLELAGHLNGKISLYLGCDFHLNTPNLSGVLADPSKYTINQQRYLLVELPEFIAPSAVLPLLRQLTARQITPIITHPERNPSIQSRLADLRQWASQGCLFQVTAQSVEGYFGSAAKNSAHAILNAGLAHFVASDAHDPHHRNPNLARCYQLVSSRYGEKQAQALFVDNPAAILSGLSLATPPVSVGLLKRFLR